MSAPLNYPSYQNNGDDPPDSPEGPRVSEGGTYVPPGYKDLSASGIAPAPGAALPALSNQLGEDDYAPGRASGADVDRHVYPNEYHGPAYGELGPRPYPN